MEIERNEPWLTEGANLFLELYFNRTQKKVNVLEFGSGSSTLWFLRQKNLASIVTIEHSSDWYSIINKEVLKSGFSKKCMSIKKNIPYYGLCREPILRHNQYDLILVDGRNRNGCIRESVPLLVSGGILILDNSERDHYSIGIEIMNGWHRMDFKQIENDKYGFNYPGWQTSIFTKP